MQPRGLLENLALRLVAIYIPLILLLLAIDQPGVAASTEANAGYKTFSGAPYPDRFYLEFKHPNVRKTFLQNGFMTSWTKIVQEPTSLQVAAGSRVELRCVVAGNPPPQVYWLSRTEAESQETVTRSLERANSVVPAEWEGISQLTSTYVIDCVKPEDAGYKYCVSVSNGEVARSKPSLLLVDTSRTEECSSESRPTITLHASWRLAYQNNTVILPCRVQGQPTYLYWLDNMGNRISMFAYARHTVLSNGDLRIRNLKWNDMGEYVCTVQSGATEKSVSTFLYPVNRAP